MVHTIVGPLGLCADATGGGIRLDWVVPEDLWAGRATPPPNLPTGPHGPLEDLGDLNYSISLYIYIQIIILVAFHPYLAAASRGG